MNYINTRSNVQGAVQGSVQGETLENTELFKVFKVNLIFFYIDDECDYISMKKNKKYKYISNRKHLEHVEHIERFSSSVHRVQGGWTQKGCVENGTVY